MNNKITSHFKLFIALLTCLVFISSAASKKENKQSGAEKKHDPGRSSVIVNEAMKKVFPDIQTSLTKIDSIYNQNKKISLKFYISPTGKMSLMGFLEPIKLDPKAEKELKMSLNMRVLDTVTEIETFTKVIVVSSLGKKKVVELSDKIEVDYVEIRSQSSILIVIDFNRRDLRKAFSRRWKEKPDLAGRITVKFGIKESGDVAYCDIVESTLNDSVFEETIVKNVKFWKFGQIYNPGDITEIVYPFTFSQ